MTTINDRTDPNSEKKRKETSSDIYRMHYELLINILIINQHQEFRTVQFLFEKHQLLAQ